MKPISDFMTEDDLKLILMVGYKSAIFFTECGDIDQPPPFIKCSNDLEEKCKAAVDTFVSLCENEIQQVVNECDGFFDTLEGVGMDLWLTRNHHGTGFWDYPNHGRYGEEIAKAFEKAALLMGEQYAYAGDDGLLYLEGGHERKTA